MNKKSKWYKTMLIRYGSDEAISAKMAANGNQAKRSRKGGFHAMSSANPELHKQLSSKGGKVGRDSKLQDEL